MATATSEPCGRRPVTGLILGLAGLAAFGLLAADVLSQGRLTQVDYALAADLASHANEHPVLLTVFRVVTFSGDKIIIGGLVTGMGVSFFVNQQRRLAVWLLVAVLGAAVLEWSLKFLFHRERPHWPEQISGWSFPSGHAMTAFVGYGLFGYVLSRRRRGVPVWYLVGLGLLVLAVGFSRMYLQHHYLTDVLGGFAVALCWLMVWIAVMEASRRRGQRSV